MKITKFFTIKKIQKSIRNKYCTWSNSKINGRSALNFKYFAQIFFSSNMKIIREIQLVNGEAIIPIRFPPSFIMTSKQKKINKYINKKSTRFDQNSSRQIRIRLSNNINYWKYRIDFDDREMERRGLFDAAFIEPYRPSPSANLEEDFNFISGHYIVGSATRCWPN